jgi:hypothetical protein
MSSLLRPVGHLPASVYWFRRALVLAVLLTLVILLVSWIGGGGDQKNAAATGPEQDPSAAPTAVPTSTPTNTPDGKSTKKTSEKPKSPESPKDSTCAGNDVRIDVVPANRTLATGSSMNLVVALSAVRDECKATIDPSRLSVKVSSGADQIWTTDHCGQVMQRATLLLAKGKQSTTTVLWNGHRSRPGCLPGQLQAKPGTYVVKAIYDGRASSEQAFNIV